MTISRRDLIKAGGLGAVGLAGLAGTGSAPFGASVLARDAGELDEEDLPTPFATAFVRPPVLRPTHFEYDHTGRLVRQHYHLVARETRVQILPRHTTRMWGYNGLVPGPTIEVDQRVATVVRIRNKLPAKHPLFGHEFAISTHLHGSGSLPEYDGYPNDLTPPGFYKEYHYPNARAARTFWYHDHAAHVTAKNAYSGLFAQYHIHDPIERALLPQGEFDVPLCISDALFRSDGELMYDDESESGLYGDVILVNGRPWPVLQVQRRVYRFRVLTPSVSRTYRFRLSTGDPVHVVATDSGLMPVAQEVAQWRQSTGERYEVLVDFSRYPPGQRVVLENLSNDNNRDYDHTGKVLAFDVVGDFGDGEVDRSDRTWNRIPTTLADSHVMGLTASSAVRSRYLEVGRTGGEWTINDSTWSDVERSGFQRVVADPGLGDVEVWKIENKSGGWFHPMHIHLADLRLLERNGRPPEPYEQGPKDTVYVAENETVRVVAQFGDRDQPQFQGRYLVHCHNNVHEDHDMMTQFAVGWKPGQPDEHDPINADPSRLDTLADEVGVAPGRMDAPEVAVRGGGVTLTWGEPDEDGGSAMTGYRLRGYVRGVVEVDVTVGDGHSHTLRDLAPGRYAFTVTGINAVGAGPQSPASGPVRLRRDRTAPRAVGRAPRPGARRVRRGRRIRARFTEPVTGVSPRTVRVRRVGGRRVRVDVAYDTETRRLVITPRRRLARDARYRVRLTRGIRDATGNRLARTAWTFSTRGA